MASTFQSHGESPLGGFLPGTRVAAAGRESPLGVRYDPGVTEPLERGVLLWRDNWIGDYPGYSNEIVFWFTVAQYQAYSVFPTAPWIHDSVTWSGVIADYRLILWPHPALFIPPVLPVWLDSQLADWEGVIVVSAEWATPSSGWTPCVDTINDLNTVYGWHNCSVDYDILDGGVSYMHQAPRWTHALTANQPTLALAASSEVMDGIPLFRSQTQPYKDICQASTGKYNELWVVCGDSNPFFNDPVFHDQPIQALDWNKTFLQNLYNYTP